MTTSLTRCNRFTALFSMNEKLVVSIIFHNKNGAGHDLEYNKALGKAAESIGLPHICILPESWEESPELPSHWHTCLKTKKHDSKKLPFMKITAIFSLARSLTKGMEKHILPLSNQFILFIESFWLFHLIALYIALCLLPSKNIKLWLLFRWNVTKDNKQSLYKVMLYLIQKRIGERSIQLLTDSELLKKVLSLHFKKSFTVMPIPHTDLNGYKSRVKKSQTRQIIGWWPGLPRLSKGLNIMQKILHENGEYAKRFKIISAKSSNLTSISGGADLEFIPDYITRLDYMKKMLESDIVLLPYDKESYNESTSGIFVEAIVAGKIPLVTDGTWMAYELLKFDLHELIFDWQAPKILNRIIKLLQNENVMNKLSKMRQFYISYHNVENYAAILNRFQDYCEKVD